MKRIPINTHTFVFNQYDNGGETFSFITKFFKNDDLNGILTTHHFILQSYCNEAKFSIMGFTITPNQLRLLATQLEIAENEAITKMRENNG